jgi:hypothetical protein
MIAFGCAITDSQIYRRCAEPGIALAREEDSKVVPLASTGLNNPDETFREHNLAGSVFRSYNVIIDQVKDLEGLEALVLLHQDAEIIDSDFCSRLRAALADPDVAIVGCAGAVDVRSIAWWEGSITWASFTHRYHEFGGGEIPAFSWIEEHMPPFARTGEVDSIDGFVMGLTPWVLQNLRFDESLGKQHGYDLDICMQARTAGKKVVTADFRVIHHHSLDLIGDLGGWIDAQLEALDAEPLPVRS